MKHLPDLVAMLGKSSRTENPEVSSQLCKDIYNVQV